MTKALDIRVEAEAAAKRLHDTRDGQILFSYLTMKFGQVTRNPVPPTGPVDPYRLAVDAGARGVMIELNRLLTMDTAEPKENFDVPENPVERDTRTYS
jgi:hypothetical protein